MDDMQNAAGMGF